MAASSVFVLQGEDGVFLVSSDGLLSVGVDVAVAVAVAVAVDVDVARASVSADTSAAVAVDDDVETDRALVGTWVLFWTLVGDTGEASVEFELTGTGINGGKAGRTAGRGEDSEDPLLGVLDTWAPWPMTLWRVMEACPCG